jgi:hypothetical protein
VHGSTWKSEIFVEKEAKITGFKGVKGRLGRSRAFSEMV